MFGTVEEDDEEDTVEEPQALVRKKAEMDKVAKNDNSKFSLFFFNLGRKTTRNYRYQNP